MPKRLNGTHLWQMLKSLWIKVPTLVLAGLAFWAIGGWVGALVATCVFFMGTAILLAIVFHPNASWWAPTLWRGSGKDTVALTFDDGPDPESTLEIARILAEQDIRAAFFVVGERVEKHPDVLAKLHADGHLVCNHTQTHAMTFHFSLWDTARRELRACNDAIKSAIGLEPALFRSPQGFKNPALGDVIGELDMKAIGWQVRGLDSMRGDADAITERIVKGAEPGGVIMLHDGSGYGGRVDRSGTIAALPRIIEGLRARGLSFSRLDELLDVEPYRT